MISDYYDTKYDVAHGPRFYGVHWDHNSDTECRSQATKIKILVHQISRIMMIKPELSKKFRTAAASAYLCGSR